MVSAPPPIHRSAAEQAVLEQRLSDSFASLPFHQALGLKAVKLAADHCQVEICTRPELIGNVLHYRLHGGAIATTLDAVGGLAICMAMAEKFCDEDMDQLAHRIARIGTIDLRIDYLYQAQGERFIATARILRLGGRIASTQMTFENANGDLVATGAAAYIVS